MCHYIQAVKTRNGNPFYYAGYDGYYYGWKRIQFYEDTIISFYLHKPYKVEWKRGFCVLSADPQTQDLQMDIATVQQTQDKMRLDTFRVTTKVLAGIHLAPFILKHRKIQPIEFQDADTSYAVPVRFLRQDVLYYDGWDISVSELQIPCYRELVPAPVLSAAPEKFADSFKELSDLYLKITGHDVYTMPF